MRVTLRRSAAPAALLLLSCGRPEPAAPIPELLPVDTALFNGRIITVDSRDTIAEALAIRAGRIVAIGSNETVQELVGPRTEVIDLRGRTATPGLIDSHCHFARGGIARLYMLDLSYPGVEAISDIADSVEAAIENRDAGDWVEGEGWDEGKLSERRYLYASDIDPVSPEHPVWLLHTMGHYGTANSLALELANITKDTPDPPGGTIDRYPDGTPTGVLKESAMDLVARRIPELSGEQVQRAIAELAGEFNQECMTAIKDPGIDGKLWDAYQRVLADGKLTVRVFALWRAGKTVDEAQSLIDRVGLFTKPYVSTGDDRLISGGIKIVFDGSGGARTAWLYDEWNKDYDDVDTGNYGYPLIDPEVFRQQVLLFHEAGLHLGVHAIGDKAIDWVVDTYASALEQSPTHGLRHSVIHANVPTEHALEIMAAMQRAHDAGYPEPSPTFMWWIGDTYAGNWGPERSLRLNPFRTYLERGIRWGASSDYNVTPFAARYGLWASIERQPLLGVYGSNPYGKEESIDVRTALRSYTRWNARQLFMEDEIGSLEPGKYADIAIWDRDLYAVPAGEIKDLRCQLTLLGGEIAYREPSAAGEVPPAP